MNRENQEPPDHPDQTSVRWALVNDRDTSPEILHKLCDQVSGSLLERIAEHPRADNHVLAKLAGHPDPEVRASVSENSNASDNILQLLVRDESLDVRYRMAENHNLAEEILEHLALDENPYVSWRARKTLLRLKMPNCVKAEFSNGSFNGDKKTVP